MTITARVTATKNASYVKTAPNKPEQQLARQIVRYYDVAGLTMGAISKQVKDIKAYLDSTLTVADVYPKVKEDPTVTIWTEDPWEVVW